MTEDGPGYIKAQLDRIELGGGQIKLQLRNSEDSTNWLNVTSEQFLALQALLTAPEGAPDIKGGALESTNPPVPHAFKYLAARQALKSYGEGYARTIESHIDELLAKGIDVRHESLGERLAGNDGD